ncbi:MAG: tyrosine--tRNA ligase [Psychroflexus halocasei]
MKKDFVKEVTWRGMVHDVMPGTQEHLNEEVRAAYVGIDPTADSLHVGHLVGVMLLKHFQLSGHKPVALIGGATGMIGDPSGKSDERNLLDEETLAKNQAGIKKQLSKFLDFESDAGNAAILVNNYDWMKEFSFIDFIRDVGKHMTVNYMMSKDSVKKRLDASSQVGLSFTEFTYQLVQGYDFLHLFRHHSCSLQMGGSDQWGNITTGTELIRRVDQEKGYALTCPLITKADGAKFGKTASGNIWLDPEKTSPFKFYQFWLNTSDDDAEKFIKIFTFRDQEEIEGLNEKHKAEPHLRALQKVLAEDLTITVHSEAELEKAQKATQVLFGKSTFDDLASIDEKTFLDVFEGVPQAEISTDIIEDLDIVEALTTHSDFLKSKGEARRALKQNSISINKEKVKEDHVLSSEDLINGKYILISKGKKQNFLLVVKS